MSMLTNAAVTVVIIWTVLREVLRQRNTGSALTDDDTDAATDHHLAIPFDADSFPAEFYANLYKTIAFTQEIVDKIADPTNIDYTMVLRTTNPLYNGKPFYTFREHEGSKYASSPYPGFDYKQVLAEALAIRPEASKPGKPLEVLGTILRFLTDISTYDGAPCAESGLVDEADIPPIDTWFFYKETYLYCWIPAVFKPDMQHVIDVEILGSYDWLEEASPVVNEEEF